ncbi:hypothetical protein [Aeromicrobium alkaliterrae]|uniref:Uncharacterized protein n=1 Tax=Aeromicrobium alkaliterrae TaxID=302168 RepID=A0ABN2JU50_9ACTN
MTNPIDPTSDAATQDAVRALEKALEDPEIAEAVRGVREHLGSFTFDPVGTLDEN